LEDGSYYRKPDLDRIQLDDLRNKIQDMVNYRVFVCLSNGDEGKSKVLGAGYLYGTGTRGHVYMLAVAKGEQRKGIGSSILKRIEECAKKEFNLSEIKLDFVNDTRERGLQAFYIKNGYQFLRTDSSTNPKKYLFEGGEKLIPVEDEKEQVVSIYTIPLVFYAKTL